MLSHAAGRTRWLKQAALLLLLAKCTSALQSVGIGKGSRVPRTHHKTWSRQTSLLAASCQEKPADRLALHDGGAILLPPDARPHRNIATLRLRGGGARGSIATFQWNAHDCERLAKVEVSGNWDNWQTRSTLFFKVGEGWSGAMELPPGEYEYKFILDDNIWTHDATQAKPSEPSDNASGPTAGSATGPMNVLVLCGPEHTMTPEERSTSLQAPPELTDEEKAVIVDALEEADACSAARGGVVGPQTASSSPLLRTLSEEAAAAAAVVQQKHACAAAAAAAAAEEAAALRAVEEAQAALAAAAAAAEAETLKLQELEQTELRVDKAKRRALDETGQWVVAERPIASEDDHACPAASSGAASSMHEEGGAPVHLGGEAAAGARQVMGDAGCPALAWNGGGTVARAPSVVTWYSSDVKAHSPTANGAHLTKPAHACWHRLPRASTLIDIFILQPAAFIDTWTSRLGRPPPSGAEVTGQGWRELGAQCLPPLAFPEVPFGEALARQYDRFCERASRRAGVPPSQGS